ncbi:MAG: class I SAM-dependent methyltransferase [Acidiferrobacteraceae bacterium]
MSTHHFKQQKIAQIIARQLGRRPERLLVVGCGSGVEAAILGHELGAQVIGIDLKPDFDPTAAAEVDLRVADATPLPFENEYFDFVYSYHVLREMRRVLTRDGGWYVGTPNRSRFAGYIGNDEVPLRVKLAWNWIDWKKRAKGRFRNEYGAHAGFTATELTSELGATLGAVRDITLDYYLEIYPNHARKISWISKTGLGRWVFPSVYFRARPRTQRWTDNVEFVARTLVLGFVQQEGRR